MLCSFCRTVFNLMNLKNYIIVCVCIIMWKLLLWGRVHVKWDSSAGFRTKYGLWLVFRDWFAHFWERLGHSLCAKDVAHHVNCLDWHMKKQFVDFSCSFSDTAVTMRDSCFWIWFVIPSDNRTGTILSCSARLHCPYCICFPCPNFV